jgi:hypothetical protein
MPDYSLKYVWGFVGFVSGLIIGFGLSSALHEQRRPAPSSGEEWPTADQKARDFEHALAHLLAASAGYIVFLATLVSIGFGYSGAQPTTKIALAALLAISLGLCVYFLFRIGQLANILLPALSRSYRDRQQSIGGDFGVLSLGAVLATCVAAIDLYIILCESSVR